MKKIFFLMIIWLLATFYIGYDHYTLQNKLKDVEDFEDYLAYSKFLVGCNIGAEKAGRIDINNYYWECVSLAYEEKAMFRKRMKRQ